jgi:hypothetical protein
MPPEALDAVLDLVQFLFQVFQQHSRVSCSICEVGGLYTTGKGDVKVKTL